MGKTASPRQVLSPNKASRASNGYIYSYSCQGCPVGTPKQPRLLPSLLVVLHKWKVSSVILNALVDGKCGHL